MPPRVVPGNPQWIEWIRTLELAAEEKGSKAANSYGKARRSLERCPIVFQHPEEALQLEAVGKKTVEILLHKIQEECNRTGLPMPERAVSLRTKKPSKAPVRDATNGNAVAGSSRKRSTQATAASAEQTEDDLREARRRRLLGLAPEPWSTSTSDAHQGHNGSGAPTPAAAPARERRAAVPKAYVPRQGSGSYAILVALYKNCSYESSQVWMTRAKIIEDAAAHSETTMDKPSAAKNGGTEFGAGFYSAWSGMATLITKELVASDNKRPIKYALTESGYTLADSLVVAAGIPKHVRGPSSDGAAPVPWNAPRPSEQRGNNEGGSFASGSGGHRLGAVPAGVPPVLPGRYPNVPTRKRRRTQSLFDAGSDEDDVRSEEDDDFVFAEQMRQVRALSRQKSHPSSSSSLGGSGASRASTSRGTPLPLTLPMPGLPRTPLDYGAASGPALNGRRASSSLYVTSVPNSALCPAPVNLDVPFGYYYLDECGSFWACAAVWDRLKQLGSCPAADKRVTRLDEAEVGQEEQTFAPIYRIEYRTVQAFHQMTRSVLRSAPLVRPTPLPGGATMTGYLRGRIANAVAPGFPSTTSVPSATETALIPRSDLKHVDLLAGYKELPPKKSKDAMYEPPVPIRRLGSDPAVQPHAARQSVASTSQDTLQVQKAREHSISRTTSAPGVPIRAGSVSGDLSMSRTSSLPIPHTERSSSSDPLPTPPGTNKRPAAPSTALVAPPAVALARPAGRAMARTTSTKNPLLASFDQLPGQTIDRHPLDPVKDHIAAAPYVHTPFSANVLLAGTFRVLLLIDMREQGVSMRGKRTEMVDALEKEDVPVDRRMLPLGDMIWVARPVDEDGRPTGQDDVVLDAIVERKRLDDLCHSIIDGRYVSQKIRLKDSGLSHRIYLIEKYDDKSQYAQFGKAIWTCKSQLQINDGFYVHESGSFKDTLTFLKMRTQIMREQYENQDLLVIPDSSIDCPTYLSMQRHLQHTSSHRYLTTYRAFAELNKNDAALTLRSQWARMLSCISGLSAEKTVQFVNRWSTPMQFFAEGSEWANIVKGDPFVSIEGKPIPKKARKEEDFVVEHLEDVGARGIKGKLGSKIWKLFQTSGAYDE